MRVVYISAPKEIILGQSVYVSWGGVIILDPTQWSRAAGLLHGLAAGDLERYQTKGFVAFKPCWLVTGQLDAAARFTLHLAGKDARSRKPMPKLGDGYLSLSSGDRLA